MQNSLRLAVVLSILLPSPALAYIGPGAGLGAFAVVVALVIGLLLLLVGLVWYPMKRMLKAKGGGTGNGKSEGSD